MHPIISGGKLRLSRAGFLMASTAAALVVGGAGGGGSGGGAGANSYVGGGTGGSTLPTYQFTRQTQRATTNTYVVPASIPGQIVAHGAAVAAGTVQNVGCFFAMGHVPDGYHLTLTQGGTTVQVQQDGETYFPDGSLRWARLTFRQPVALVADQVANVLLTPTAGAPDRTALITPAALVAAKDVIVRSFAGDAGSITFETSLREIVTNVAQDSNTGAAPSNPIAGWSVVASGPVEVMLKGWRYRHDKTQALTTGYHGLVLDEVFLSKRVDGTYETMGRSLCPNWAGSVANSGVTPAATTNGGAPGMASVIEMYDDAGTRLGAWGGSHDARTTTLTQAMFNVSNNTTTLSTLFPVGTAIMFSGPGVPSGVTQGKPYYADGNGVLWTYRCRATGQFADNDSIVLGTAGSGAVTVIPLVAVFGGSGAPLLASDALPIRIGGTRVETAISWSLDYLCKGAKAFPCYDTSYTQPASTIYSAPYGSANYVPNTPALGYWLNASGDDAGDWRIGLIHEPSLLALLSPLDAGFARQARMTGASWSDAPIWWRDERSGRAIALGNGPDDVGGQWPGLGPNCPARTFQGGGTDGWMNQYSGYFSGYGSCPTEASHMPCPWIVPALQTGCFAYIDQGAAHFSACSMSANPTSMTIGGQTYYYPVGMQAQLRGSAWFANIARFAEMVTPFARPEAALIRHIWDRTWQYYTQAMLAAVPAQVTLGAILPVNSTDTQLYGYPGFGDACGFYIDLWSMICMLQVRDGIRPLVRPCLEVIANLCVGVANDAGPTKGTGYVQSGGYHPTVRNADGSWCTIQQLMDQAQYNAGSRPYPATGMSPEFGSKWNGTGWRDDICNDYASIKLAALGMLKEIGIVSTTNDDAYTVHDLLRTRLNTAPCRGVQWATGSSDTHRQGPHSYPTFSMVAAA